MHHIYIKAVKFTYFLMDLKGKNVIITGGANGIGLACVKEYLASGIKKIVILDINDSLFDKLTKELDSGFGPNRVKFIKTDVTDTKNFNHSFEEAVAELKWVDVLHNNAGILSESLWHKTVDVNIKGVINGILLGLKFMSKKNGGQGGTILNTSSIAGLGASPVFPVYAATKYAVIGLTVAYGAPEEYNQTGVRVMVLCPGVTKTGIFSTNPYTDSPIENTESVKSTLSTFQMQSTDPVAKAAVYIIQNAVTGSAYVTDDSKTYEVEIPLYSCNGYKTKLVI